MKDKVTVCHPEYDENKSVWEKCRDAIAGEDAVKAKDQIYLPMPTGHDSEQYKRYKQRARYYNAVQRISESIVGQIFRKKPVIAPSDMDLSSVSNTGQDFVQFSKEVLQEVVDVGRSGILVDYGPDKPMFIKILAENIINWKYQYINGEQVTTLVVIKEAVINPDYTFAHEYEDQYRVLSLVNGIYVQNVYTKDKSGSGEDYIKSEDIVPLVNGQPFNFIPFFCQGTKGISLDVKKPIIKDIVDINIGHYINAADYENDLHWSGIKTPCFPGWKSDHGPICVGKPIGTPTGATPFMLESSSNSGLKDEMTKKEERMAAIGSNIIAQQGRYIQSAQTSNNQMSGETSVLASLSDAMDSLFTKLLMIYAFWAGEQNPEISVSFNKDFDPGAVNMDNIVKLSALNDNQKISYNTFYEYLKKSELVPKDKTPEMEYEEIANEEARINGGNL